MKPKKLKRVVIREEFVVLLDNTCQAVLLAQMLYWHERTKDAAKYIEEEKNRLHGNDIESDFTAMYGWIYKSANELADEVMLGLSENTIRKNMKLLVEKGHLQEKRDPKYKWNRTYYYRVDLVKLIHDLEELGFELEGYKMLQRNLEKMCSNNIPEGTNLKFGGSNNLGEGSNQTECGAISEITTEATTDITTKTSSTSEKLDEDDEAGNEGNQDFQIISKAYLKLANKTTLSVSDTTAIVDVVNQNWPTDQVVSWVHECYEKFQPRHPRDFIRSFQYVANYIFDQAARSEILGGTLNDEDERLISKFAGNHSETNRRGAEDEYFKRYRTDVSAENPECDF